MADNERPDNQWESFLSDVAIALSGFDYSLGALVAIERFRILSESGTDPLEGTIFERHGFREEEWMEKVTMADVVYVSVYAGSGEPTRWGLQRLAAALNRRTLRLHESLLPSRQVGAVGRRVKRARPPTCSG